MSKLHVQFQCKELRVQKNVYTRHTNASWCKTVRGHPTLQTNRKQNVVRILQLHCWLSDKYWRV